MLSKLWTLFLAPVLTRPARYQVAALCWRGEGAAREVLLATSLDTGRWILPKGWPKRGRSAAAMAQEEAWEEAGVIPRHVRAAPIGRFRYVKRMSGGTLPAPTVADVIAIEVERIADHFPEKGRRELRWMRPEAAAELVEEPELQALLRDLPRNLRG